jgi:hypothetical protein
MRALIGCIQISNASLSGHLYGKDSDFYTKYSLIFHIPLVKSINGSD